MTEPVVGSNNPAIIERRVDLPHPLGPRIEMNSPSFTESVISSKAVVAEVFEK
jgi:hypothetical protein